MKSSILAHDKELRTVSDPAALGGVNNPISFRLKACYILECGSQP